MDEFEYRPFGGGKSKKDSNESSDESSDEEFEGLDALTENHASSKSHKSKHKPLMKGRPAAKRARKDTSTGSGRMTRRSAAQAVIDAEDDNDKPSPVSVGRAGKPDICALDESDSDDDLSVDVVDDDPATERMKRDAEERRRKREALQRQFDAAADETELEVEEVTTTRAAPRLLQKRPRPEDIEEVDDSEDEGGSGGGGGGGGGGSGGVASDAIVVVLKLPHGKEHGGKDQKFGVMPSNPLSKLLSSFCGRNGYKEEDVTLRFDGDVLPYAQTANELDLETDDMIEVQIREGAVKNPNVIPRKGSKRHKMAGVSSSSSACSSASSSTATIKASSSSGRDATPTATAPATPPSNFAPNESLIVKVLVPGTSKPKKLKFRAHDPLHKLLSGFCSATKEAGHGLSLNGESLDLARTPAQLGNIQNGTIINLVR